MKQLKQLTQDSYAQAKDSGFWDGNRSQSELLMLIVSELGEAQEAHRKGRFSDLKGYDKHDPGGIGLLFRNCFEDHIKDTFEDELADCVIRMCDFCGGYEIPLEHNSYMETVMGSIKLQDNIGAQLLDLTEIIVFLNGNLDRRTFVDEFCNRFVAMMFVWCRQLNIDIEKHVELKMKYNATRERLHGKKY